MEKDISWEEIDDISSSLFCRGQVVILNSPRKIIFLHRTPIISRESPVLTVYGEIVGRSTSLAIHIEVFRFHPCLDTRTVHPYRQIAFQHDPVLAGIIGNTLKLGMQDILQEIQERYFRICLALHGTKFTDVIQYCCWGTEEAVTLLNNSILEA